VTTHAQKVPLGRFADYLHVISKLNEAYL
jgi:hypothetical protein